MTSAAQPNPIDALTADAELDRDAAAAAAAQEPEYAGDLPDDPEQAVHFRPGQDEQTGDAR